MQLHKNKILRKVKVFAMDWVVKKENHLTRFFGTTWNSRISLKRWHKASLGKRGFYFFNGYMEIQLGNWVLRYRNNK